MAQRRRISEDASFDQVWQHMPRTGYTYVESPAYSLSGYASPLASPPNMARAPLGAFVGRTRSLHATPSPGGGFRRRPASLAERLLNFFLIILRKFLYELPARVALLDTWILVRSSDAFSRPGSWFSAWCSFLLSGTRGVAGATLTTFKSVSSMTSTFTKTIKYFTRTLLKAWKRLIDRTASMVLKLPRTASAGLSEVAGMSWTIIEEYVLMKTFILTEITWTAGKKTSAMGLSKIASALKSVTKPFVSASSVSVALACSVTRPVLRLFKKVLETTALALASLFRAPAAILKSSPRSDSVTKEPQGSSPASGTAKDHQPEQSPRVMIEENILVKTFIYTEVMREASKERLASATRIIKEVKRGERKLPLLLLVIPLLLLLLLLLSEDARNVLMNSGQILTQSARSSRILMSKSSNLFWNMYSFLTSSADYYLSLLPPIEGAKVVFSDVLNSATASLPSLDAAISMVSRATSTFQQSISSFTSETLNSLSSTMIYPSQISKGLTALSSGITVSAWQILERTSNLVPEDFGRMLYQVAAGVYKQLQHLFGGAVLGGEEVASAVVNVTYSGMSSIAEASQHMTGLFLGSITWVSMIAPGDEGTEAQKTPRTIGKVTDLESVLRSNRMSSLLSEIAREEAKAMEAEMHTKIDSMKDLYGDFKQHLQHVDKYDHLDLKFRPHLLDKLREGEEHIKNIELEEITKVEKLIADTVLSKKTVLDPTLSNYVKDMELKISSFDLEKLKLGCCDGKRSLFFADLIKERFAELTRDLLRYEELVSKDYINETLIVKKKLLNDQASLNFTGSLTNAANDATVQYLMTRLNAELSEERRDRPTNWKGSLDKAIDDALLLHAADHTGRFDYALESSGGSVVSIRCTETFYQRSGVWSFMGIPLWYSVTGPRRAIQPGSRLPGQCWPFRGSRGYLVVELSKRVRPTHFTLEHIPRILSPDGQIDSAPKGFVVKGLMYERDLDPIVFGEYAYDASDKADALQTFPVVDNIEAEVKFVELEITSNHGNPVYTCLYRFRVHGIPTD